MTTSTVTSTMTTIPLESSDPKDSCSPDKDPDPKQPAIIPLRQRRLPASFWQEPSIVPTTPVHHQDILPSPNLPFPSGPLHPWAIGMGGGPTYLPQRLSVPGSFALVQHPTSMWMRGPALGYCSCTACLNYPCVAAPRIPDLYGGLRYIRPSACPGSNCADLGCKICTVSGSWCPERVRQSRLRSARYNALLD